MKNQTDPQIIGFYAGILSLAEIGLGSLLHGLKVPLAGTFLSLNQSLFLTRLTKINQHRTDSRILGFQVSNITALLKSLSPAGKKLLPMLAIATQGLLFSLGTLLLGPNLPGCLLGAALSSTWGIIQPLALLWVIYGTAFGQDQFNQILAYFNKFFGELISISSHSLVYLVLGFIFIKMLFAMALVFLGWRASIEEDKLVNHALLKFRLKGLNFSPRTQSNQNAAWGALTDISKPLFLFPLAMTGIFFWFAEHDRAHFIWMLCRPLAIGYLLLLGLRLVPIEKWVQKQGWGGPALKAALSFIEGTNSQEEGHKHDR